MATRRHDWIASDHVIPPKKGTLPLQEYTRLSVYPRYIKYPNSEISRGSRVFGKEQDYTLEPERSSNTNAIATGEKLTSVRIYSVNPVPYKDIQRNFVFVPEKSQTKKKAAKVKKIDADEDKGDDWVVGTQGYKSGLSEQYSRKSFKEHKNSGKKRVPKSALQGGHCLHCLQPFQTLRANNANSSCWYHPGYTIHCESGPYWSCCEEEALGYVPTSDDHRSSGCRRGQHIWKTNRKTGAKPSAKFEQNCSTNSKINGMSSRDALLVANCMEDL